MERRHFLQLLTAGGAASISPLLPAEKEQNKHASNRELTELEQHTISDMFFTDVALHYPRQVGKNAQLDIHGMGPTVRVGIIHTNKGAAGWGMLQGGDEEEAAAYLKEKRITEVFTPSEGITDQAIRPFDLVLHDLS